jgi:SMI1/KNR4 family protein SUKH-1
LGSAFWVAEWGYPDIGVYIADCPSAGHDMIALDYRRPGEPAVVHIDQEWDYQITVLAPDFETFVRGLADELDYDERNKDG